MPSAPLLVGSRARTFPNFKWANSQAAGNHAGVLGIPWPRELQRRIHAANLKTFALNRSRMAASLRSDGIRPRKSGSHWTPRWREMDSNPRSPV
jgi:hypothetical protein